MPPGSCINIPDLEEAEPIVTAASELPWTCKKFAGSDVFIPTSPELASTNKPWEFPSLSTRKSVSWLLSFTTTALVASDKLLWIVKISSALPIPWS